MCLDRTDAKTLWQAGTIYTDEEPTHRTNPYCSASPATDGKLVIVSYGSAGVACYDFEGKEQWRRDFGALDHVWGNSASPVLYGDLCIHYHGPGPGGFLIALNKKTGETVWKVEEPAWKPGERTDGFKGDPDGVIGSFSTPILVDTGKRTELIMSYPMEIRALDPKSGNELWRCGGLNPLVYTATASSLRWAATTATRSPRRSAATATSPQRTASGSTSATTAASAAASPGTASSTTTTPAASGSAST